MVASSLASSSSIGPSYNPCPNSGDIVSSTARVPLIHHLVASVAWPRLKFSLTAGLLTFIPFGKSSFRSCFILLTSSSSFCFFSLEAILCSLLFFDTLLELLVFGIFGASLFRIFSNRLSMSFILALDCYRKKFS